jgi:phage terminase small subunit
MAQDLPEEEVQENGFTMKQQRFIEEFCVDGNCTQAAKRAGYSPASAYSIGSENLKKPEIKTAIDSRLATLSLGAAEVTKLTSEIAQSRLNDFFTIREVQGYEQEEHYLSVLASRQRDEIVYINDFVSREGLLLFDFKGGLTPMGERLNKAREKLLELELEILAYGPDATKLVAGKPVIHRIAELDLVKLAEAKEGGRIKSYSVGKDGIKVETYAADAALDKMARMHGLYEKDNRQLGGIDVEIIIGDSPE